MVRNSNWYRKLYEEKYGPIPKDRDGRSYHIHHLDGNHSNNELSNLTAISIKDHYDIHYSQGDYGACYLIARDLKLEPGELAELASKYARKKVNDGSHHFLGGAIQRKNNRKRIAKGTHNFLGGHLQRKMAKEGKHVSQVTWVCEHCNKEGKGTGMYALWHGNNCKLVRA